mmetsp:Transcript_63490/g.184052  ORF Transcript_63490/g.184052 Transcript_63490/m.184052 type:complete len:259 (-) Transcript_63490:672-1448(-)
MRDGRHVAILESGVAGGHIQDGRHLCRLRSVHIGTWIELQFEPAAFACPVCTLLSGVPLNAAQAPVQDAAPDQSASSAGSAVLIAVDVLPVRAAAHTGPDERRQHGDGQSLLFDNGFKELVNWLVMFGGLVLPATARTSGVKATSALHSRGGVKTLRPAGACLPALPHTIGLFKSLQKGASRTKPLRRRRRPEGPECRLGNAAELQILNLLEQSPPCAVRSTVLLPHGQAPLQDDVAPADVAQHRLILGIEGLRVVGD